jgi:hypothetical protein
MATVIRPPFFVPRPPDDNIWNAAPTRAPVIPFLTKQKMFGAGGQVPAKQWHQLYDYDDASVWYAKPTKSNILQYLTFQKMFGVFGQVPATQWFSDFDDNFSGWLFAFTNRNQSILTPTVSAPFKTRPPSFNYDDPPVWSGGPRQRQLIWQPFLYYRLKYNYDDHTLWHFSYINQNQSILTPTAAANPFVPAIWNYRNDDAPAWSGNPISSAIITPLLTAAGQVKSSQRRYDLDDVSAWSAWLNRNLSVTTPTVNPFVNVTWKHSDDPTVWSNQVNRNLLITTPAAKPFVNVAWSNTDDFPSWQSAPSGLAPIVRYLTFQRMFGSGGQVPTKQWRYDYDDASAWFPWINKNLANATAIQPKPFVVVTWSENYDEAAIWQPARYRNLVAITPQPAPFLARARYNYDDWYTWQPAQYRNAALAIQIASPFSTRVWNFVSDDLPRWQWQPSSQAIQYSAPFRIRNKAPVFYDEPVDWLGMHRASPATILVQAQPFLPFTPSKRNWNYYFDDAVDWIGTHTAMPYAIWRALLYVFVPSPRVGNTTLQMRSADAASKLRSGDATLGLRSGDASDEVRSGDAAASIRSSNTESGT